MRTTSTLVSATILVLTAGSVTLGQAQKGATAPPQSPTPASGGAPTGAAATATPRLQITGLSAPESVLYDPDADVYLVSNINGSPFAKDDNGFIARVSPSGEMLAPKWIDGARTDVTLNAPKGMAFLGNTLYVADLDTVRTFDRKTGAVKGQIPIPGATFLNDVVAGKDVVYVSDTGVKEGFRPSGSAAIYEVGGGKAKAVGRGDDLHGPNGLAMNDKGLWCVTFASDELFRLDPNGRKVDVTKLPQGQLDGLLILKDGTFLVSSWKARGIYAGRPGGEFLLRISGVTSPADIGFDTKRSLVLVPQLQEDKVQVFDWAPRAHFGRTPPPSREGRMPVR